MQGRDSLGWQPGVALLIPRSLSEAFGHMAYAGCFGYFIGLAVLKQEQRWKILAIGLVSSSLLHARGTRWLRWTRISAGSGWNRELCSAGCGDFEGARDFAEPGGADAEHLYRVADPTASVVAAYAGGGGLAAVPAAGAGFMATGFGWGECASSAEAEGGAGTESAAGGDG